MSTIGNRWLFAAVLLFTQHALGTPTQDPEILRRRGVMPMTIQALTGKTPGGKAPTLTVIEPFGGWTASQMLRVKGSCSDPSADPLLVAVNGTRYYVRNMNGQFNRQFPAAKGKNNVTVTCRNAEGESVVERSIDAQIPSVPLKVVLTSDTDGVYTDLHIYEPNGAHVYWAETRSPTGGLFFLNSDGGSSDQVGYGPYLYTHSAPPVGTFRIDTNYWPGGAMQHTIAALDLVINEGQPNEMRRRVKKPLARPGETATLAFVTFRENGLPPQVYIPGQDDPALAPKNPPIVNPSDVYDGAALDSKSGPTFAVLKSFRSALTSFALQQARKPSPKWDEKQRDCAGFIRFVYREVMRPRSDVQREENALPKKLNFPIVADEMRRLLPAYPKLWRVPGPSTNENVFKPFADAEHLVTYNFRSVGRSISSAEAGDLLVFKRMDDPEQPFHLMMVVAPKASQKLVVYHNGQVGRDAQIRVLNLELLARPGIPEPSWAPLAQNKYFLGVYRWKVLKGEPQA